MFEKNERPKEMTSEENNETIVGSSVKLEGDLISSGNISIHGDVVGKVHTEKDVLIGDTATVKADLKGDNVTVAGRVEGNIKADGKLNITENGKVFGDVVVSSISINDGAMFSGHCQMGVEGSDDSANAESEKE